MVSRVVGGTRFRKALRKMPVEARAEVAKALDESIRMIQQTAVNLAPVRTGRLRRGLASRGAVGKKDKGLQVEFGFRTRGLREKIFYAPFVEYGRKAYRAGDTRISGRSKGGRLLKRVVPRNVSAQAARPFMRPALEINLPRIRRLLNDAVKRAMVRAARG